MAKQQTKPWHEVMRLREELRTGERAPERLRAELDKLLAKISEELKIS